MPGKRVPLSLNRYEYHILTAARVRFVFTDKYLLEIPDIKHIIRATLYHTLFAMKKHKGSMMSFINSISKKKGLPLLAEDIPDTNPDNGERFEVFIEGAEESKASGIPDMDFSLTRTYVYTVEKEDEEHISGIMDVINENAKVKIPNLKQADIIKEAFHFILDNKKRNMEFSYYTLLGSLFDLSPTASLKIFLNNSGRFEEVVNRMSKAEIAVIMDIKEDSTIYEKFKESLEEVKNRPKNTDELWRIMQGHTSSYGGFNYMEAFFGTWLMSIGIPGNITVTSYLAMEAMLMKMPDERFKQMKELFVSMMDVLFDISSYLVERH